MARQIAGSGFSIYVHDYDSGAVDTLDFATVETTRHNVVRRCDGVTVGQLIATWGDHDLIRLQASGMITTGLIDLARWTMSDAADQAAADFDIVPPIG